MAKATGGEKAGKVTVWHNPRCSKSRQALALLAEMGIEPELRFYLDTPPSANEIKALLRRLQDAPAELVRTGEPAFREQGVRAVDLDAGGVAALIARHPVLLQRPVIEHAGRASIARTPEAVRAAVRRS
jgi:arsenate reductase